VGERILIVAAKAGYQAQTFAEAAVRLGFEPILATDRCGSLDDPWADHAFPLKFHQPEQSALRLAREIQGISGIVAVGDKPALAAAHIAPHLGLPFHPPDAVEAAGNKYLARQRYAGAGLNVPRYYRVTLETSAAEAALHAPWPCVLKPLGLAGSRGVIRANGEAEFIAAFERIRTLLNAPEMLRHRDPSLGFIQIEEYIPGREFALEGLVTQGRLQTLAIFDKPDPLDGPFFEETIYLTPSRQPPHQQQSMQQAIQQAVTALGLWHGPVHAELRVNQQGVWVLETAARPIGGLCARVLRFEGGLGLEDAILHHALGHDTAQLRCEPQAAGVMMVPIPRDGIYETCTGADQARAVPSIESVEITATPGQYFRRLPEGGSYLGFLFARAMETAQVEAALRQAHACLNFRFSTVLPVVRRA
jgi:biotin carboxylase